LPPVLRTFYAEGDLSGLISFVPASSEYLSSSGADLSNGTGDFELVMYVQIPDTTPTVTRTFIGHWGAVLGDRGMRMRLLTTGALQITINDTDVLDNITTGTSVWTDAGWTDGTAGWLRIRLDADDGASDSAWVIDFSFDPVDTDVDSISWSNFANPGSSGAVVALRNPTGIPWEIGGANSGVDPWDGDIHYAEFWRDGWNSGGTKVFEADFRHGPVVFDFPDKLAAVDWTVGGGTPDITGTQPIAEQDTAFAVAQVTKTVTVGLATETDTALPIQAPVLVNLATETDTAQQIGGIAYGLQAISVETDSANAVTIVKTDVVLQATETDTAQPVTILKTEVAGLATETDSALTVDAITKDYTALLATETDSVPAVVTVAKAATAGQALETDTALPIVTEQIIAVNQATETDSAQAPSVAKFLIYTGDLGAYDGFLDLDSAGSGSRIGLPDWNNGSDHGFTDPSSSLEVRIDINIVSGFGTSENIIACASGSSNRQWAITASVGSITNIAYAFSTGGTTWNTFVEGSGGSMAGNKRMQLRVVHIGTAVTLYERNPATHDLPLDNDSNWTEVGSFPSEDNVNTMADELSGFRIATGLTGGLIHQDIVYEAWVKYDGVKQAWLIGGDTLIDAGNNRVTDELGNFWGWLTETDPTVTANGTRGFCVEEDSAFAVTVIKTAVVAQAVETDTALAAIVPLAPMKQPLAWQRRLIALSL
jgi:hypothetical protein